MRVAREQRRYAQQLGSRLGSEPLKGSHLPFVHVTSWVPLITA
jgi:hypothetical protein